MKTAYNNLPVLVRRALVHGIAIYPIMLNAVMTQYEKYKMPDKVLENLSRTDLMKYIDGLHLCSREAAGDWVRGHAALIELGFEKHERVDGHRCFISLQYPTLIEETPDENEG